MIIRLEQPEIGALILHMTIMRKNVRKGFKSNYRGKSKEILSSYDEVKQTLINVLEKNEGYDGWSDLHFNIKEVEMLDSFLGFYTKELDKVFDKPEQLKKEDQEQIVYLNAIKNKMDELKVNYA